MGKMKLAGAALATAAIACACFGIFSDNANASLPQGTIGYIKGSWTMGCQGEPMSEGACSTSDEHVRCFKVVNQAALPVFCNTAMKARLKNPGTLFTAAYTTTAPLFVTSGSVVWVCLAWDPILQNNGEDPHQWEITSVQEPVSSCGKQPGAPPPCDEKTLQKEQCPSARPLPRCDSPLGDCT